MDKLEDFKMGADPEFLAIDSYGNLIQADDYGDGHSPLGCDGNGILFEARPIPDYNPINVVNNIHKIFSHSTFHHPTLSKCEWRAGSAYQGQTIGGHIHFGIKDLRSRFGSGRFCRVLSEYVGALTLLLEDKEESLARRITHGYGGSEDYRNQDYGIEYRTPSSWLVSPYITAATLCLAKIVASNIINNPKFYREHPCQFDTYTFSNHKVEDIKLHFDKIWKEIQQMPLYPLYKGYLEIFPILIKSERSWFPTCSMKEAWGLADFSQYNKKIKVSNIWSAKRIT